LNDVASSATRNNRLFEKGEITVRVPSLLFPAPEKAGWVVQSDQFGIAGDLRCLE
jgi:hypothetical protein